MYLETAKVFLCIRKQTAKHGGLHNDFVAKAVIFGIVSSVSKRSSASILRCLFDLKVVG